MLRTLGSSLAATFALTLAAVAQPIVTANGETMRLKSSSVVANGAAFTVTLTMNDDNGNAALGTSFRRWWHCEIGNLRPQGETLLVRVANAGYTDIILPVLATSTDGVNFTDYVRAPLSALPVLAGTTHSFTLQTPPGAIAIRLAKFFPYSVTKRDQWIAGIATDPRVRSVTSLGTTAQGRSIPLLELTHPAVPDAGKHRIWIHAGIHPSETTSYFTVEGLVAALLSGSPATELLLSQTIVDIVPMANPDGVTLGNYRTNSLSANLEDLWAAPYSNTEKEIVALRTRIEQLMGTTSAPGSNPIELLLNLHSSHDVSYPFHFQHVANASFDLVTSRTGVVPAVNALEGRWITAFKARSAFANRGTTQSSTMGAPARPFVESMMHDRWSIDPLWTGAPNFKKQVMAITFEGTYGKGPDQVTWCTPDDYRECGRGMALALADHFGLLPGGVFTAYGAPCGAQLGAQLANAATRLDLLASAAAPSAPSVLAFGILEQSYPLPGTSCLLRTDPLVTTPMTVAASGAGVLGIPLPPIPALALRTQLVQLVTTPLATFTTSNGLLLQIAR